MHAQVMSAAELALGLRAPGTTRADVRDALWTRRELVKTYGPRGTVHVVAASELAAWCGALSAAPWAPTRHPPSVRMTPDQMDAVVDAIDAALSQADLTVDELDAAVPARAGSWAGELVVPGFDGWWPRWRLAIPTAAYRGVLCFGPDRGRRTTYSGPRRWVPGFAGPGTADALRGLVLDYLASYGPATADQIALWLGVPATAMRPVVGSMAADLAEVELDGTAAHLPAGDAEPEGDEDGETLHLLPYFDPYVVGCHPRSRLFPGDASVRALSHGQAGTRAALIVGGTVAGIWHHRRAGRTLHVTVEPFGELSARQRSDLDGEVERVAAVLQATPTLSLGPVAAKSHL
jgi:DNA glycosylase AlkZ-like